MKNLRWLKKKECESGSGIIWITMTLFFLKNLFLYFEYNYINLAPFLCFRWFGSRKLENLLNKFILIFGALDIRFFCRELLFWNVIKRVQSLPKREEESKGYENCKWYHYYIFSNWINVGQNIILSFKILQGFLR